MIIFSINKQTSEPAIARPNWIANSVAPAEIDAAQQISIKSDQKVKSTLPFLLLEVLATFVLAGDGMCPHLHASRA